jgi:NhaP-type Na+/H+ or K+/H+ antiporter
MGLLFGTALREINKKTRIPYTPMLLVLGMFFGYARHSLGTFGQSVDIIATMSPHMILMVFIPVLLFESGTHPSTQPSTATGMSLGNL